MTYNKLILLYLHYILGIIHTLFTLCEKYAL
jgi:hypothetical protein